jgi:hypothetical protein
MQKCSVSVQYVQYIKAFWQILVLDRPVMVIPLIMIMSNSRQQFITAPSVISSWESAVSDIF